jgi:ABC-type Fe3+-hydroxamate transport system substrate-binding protein
MKKTLVALVLSLLLVACSQNTIKDEESKGGAKTATETTQPVEKSTGEQNVIAAQPERMVTIPDEVKQKYKSLIISVTDKKANKDIETEVLIGQKAEASGTALEIEVEYYLPDFTMDGNIMTSKSAKENNPAAKVKIYKGGNEVFDGWLFKNFPDMHPYVDEEYAVSLKGSVVNK